MAILNKKSVREDRKSPREIKVLIIRALINRLNSPISMSLLAKTVGCNFPTTKKYSLDMEKENMVIIIRVDEGNESEAIVGVQLNYESFMLLVDAMKEEKLEESA